MLLESGHIVENELLLLLEKYIYEFGDILFPRTKYKALYSSLFMIREIERVNTTVVLKLLFSQTLF